MGFVSLTSFRIGADFFHTHTFFIHSFRLSEVSTNLDLDEMVLDVLLQVVVRQRLSGVEKLRQLLIRSELTAIVIVLQIVLLDVQADGLGHIDAGHQLLILDTGELLHLLRDLDRLHKARVGGTRSALTTRALDRETQGIGLQLTDVLGHRTQETGALVTVGTQCIDLLLDGGKQLIKRGLQRLASHLATLATTLLSRGRGRGGS